MSRRAASRGKIKAGCLAITNAREEWALIDNGKIVRVLRKAPRCDYKINGIPFGGRRHVVWVVESLGSPFVAYASEGFPSTQLDAYGATALIPLDADMSGEEEEQRIDSPIGVIS